MQEFQVIVGNLGCVYNGPDEIAARQSYAECCICSASKYWRGAGEDVALFMDGEPTLEYCGTNNQGE